MPCSKVSVILDELGPITSGGFCLLQLRESLAVFEVAMYSVFSSSDSGAYSP